MSQTHFSKEFDVAAGQFTRERDYWLEQLAGELERRGFPYDSDSAGGETGVFRFSFPGDVFRKLEKLSNRSHLRMYIALVSALNALLGLYAGKEDILIAAPIYKQEVEGILVNSVLTFRGQVTPGMSFRELLMQMSRTIFQANEHQNYPLETLLYKLNLPYTPGEVCPLFEVGILLDNIHHRKYLDPVRLNMLFHFSAGEEGLNGTIEYNNRLYRSGTIERISRHFSQLLRSAFEAMDAPLPELEVMTPEELEQVVTTFNDTAVPSPPGRTLVKLFADRVAANPGAVAITGPSVLCPPGAEVSLTYRQLSLAAHKVALDLREKGVGSGHIVAIQAERSVEMVIGILGILKTGAAYLPIAPDSPPERTRYMTADAGVRIMVTACRRLDQAKLPEVSVVPVEGRTPPPPGTQTWPEPGPAEPIYIIYTSGTTGRPKGVIVEHRNVLNTVQWFIRRYQLRTGTPVLQVSDYTFDPSVEQIFGTLCAGGGLLVAGAEVRADMGAMRDFIRRHHVELINFVPGHLKELLGSGPRARSLRAVISGGDRLDRETAELLMNRGYTLYNHYGPTEVTVDALCGRCRPGGPVTLGKPIDNAACYILRNGRPVPIGVCGELAVGGAGIARGYLNRPELTAKAFGENPFVAGGSKNPIPNQRAEGPPSLLPSPLSPLPSRLYHTGDLARWLPNGEIEFMGRGDHQVKIRGFRVEVEEIENRLQRHPDITEAVVAAHPGPGGAPFLCAYIVPGPGVESTPGPGELREFLEQALPGYMVPAHFTEIPELPLTATGKVDRRGLPVPRFDGGGAYTAPRDEVEKTLVSIWAEVLELGPGSVGIDLNFFESGGHSLNATVMVSKVHQELQVKIPMVELFRGPTIREAAQYVKSAAAEAYSAIRPAPPREHYPLSSAQQRLYILQMMDDTYIAYNLPSVTQLKGAVDKERVESAFRTLVQRHESFRTSFTTSGGTPVQVIHAPEDVSFSIDYGRTGRRSGSTGDLDRVIGACILPFDLTQPPLLHVALIETGPEEFLLFLDMHHIIADGISTGILVREFSALYAEPDTPLPPLRLQYKDYAHWQREQAEQQGETVGWAPQRSFWMEQLQGELPVLNLPLDFRRPGIQSFEGAVHRFRLDAGTTAGLKALAEGAGATFYMVILAIYNILVSRLSGAEDIIVGTPVAARRHADLANIVGMFVNTLPLRNAPRGDLSFTGFLEDLTRRTLNAFENQEYPFELLVDDINAPRDTGRNPLFDTVFSFENLEIPHLSIPGLDISPMEDDQLRTTSKFDLTLIALETGDGLSLLLEYAVRLFKEETIRRFAGYFKELTASVLEAPTRRVADFSVIPLEERERLLMDFNRLRGIYPTGDTLHGLFYRQVEKNAGETALSGLLPDGTSVSLTYGELDIEAEAVARRLRAGGIRPGNIVGLLSEHSVPLVYGILGILKAGAAYLPMDPRSPRRRINFMLADSAAQGLLISPLFHDAYGTFDDWGGPVFRLFPGAGDDDVVPPGDMGHGAVSPSGASPLAYVIYTSGSTGTPKCVAMPHANVLPLLHWEHDCLGVGPGDRTIRNLSYYFDMAILEMFITLTSGAAFFMPPEDLPLDANGMLNYINSNHISILHVTPTQCQYLVKAGRNQETLKYLIAAGEKLTVELLEAMFEFTDESCRIFNMYGPTETAIISAVEEADRSRLDEYRLLSSVPIGYAVGHTALLVLDRYHGLCPTGTAGELYIAGDGLARGYLNRPELTAERFVFPEITGILPPRLYQTGDRVRRLANGAVEFLGRIDHQVKIRGFRIELGEIENQLRKHPSVKEAAVLALTDGSGDPYICAYTVPVETGGTPPEDLIEFLGRSLPAYMVPAFYVEMMHMPLNPNGKIDRKALPAPEAKSSVQYVAPATDHERGIAAVWREVLGVEQVGVHDNFFDVGGNSVKIIKLSVELKNKLGREVPVAKMFQYPTIAGFARFLAGDADNAHPEETVAHEPAEENLNTIKNRLKQRRARS